MTTTSETQQQNGGATLVKPPEAAPIQRAPQANTELFAGAEDWSTAQRIATALSNSTLVPKEYQGNISNVLIAMEIAGRVKASVFSVMQSLDVIHGRPSWRAQFLIATVNQCGRFTPLRYHFEGTKGQRDYGCKAVAADVKTGEVLEGELVTLGMAQDEGWATKNGSKYKTMAGQMLRYRAASFWVRTYAPELSLGMQTSDELHDTLGTDVSALPTGAPRGSAASLESALGMRASAIDMPGETVVAIETKATTIEDENGNPAADAKTAVEPTQQPLPGSEPTKRTR